MAAETSAEGRAAAETLFNEGGQLFRQGKYEEACTKLASSQRLDPAVGTLLNLGRCYEKLGKTASAWLAFIDAASAAKAAGQSDREKTAREGASRLEPSLPKLRIQVAEDVAVEGLEVTRDQEPVPSALWNTDSPTDPGAHTIDVRAPGKQPWSTTAQLEAAKTATVVVPTLVDAPGQGPASEGKGAEGEQGGLGTQRLIALVTGGVGVGALAAGTVFGFKAKAEADKADETCGESTCPDTTSLDANNRAHTQATLSTIFISAGAALVAGGAVLWFTAPSHRDVPAGTDQAARLTVVPLLEPSTQGISVEGWF